MRRRKKIIPLFIATLLLWLLVVWMTFSFSPEAPVRIRNYELGIRNLFFPLIFITSSLTFTLVLNNTRRGLLMGLGVTTFLILRFLQLTHPFYITLLLLTLVALEFTFRKS